ncbi:MAG: YeeE/YedE family protein [Thermoanaerobacteraceae bacterium]|nr:YeeE/YedE family protein [Thermoanaerobacteraceae bacterium]
MTWLKKIMVKLDNYLSSSWPHWAGAVVLALLNITLFTLFHRPWGVTSTITKWGFALWSFMDGDVVLNYLQQIGSSSSFADLLINEGTILNLGVVTGVLLAALAASQFRVKRVKSGSQVLLGVAGGLLMGYGARLALGCNIGALLGGIASQSLHGWVFGFFLFIGAVAGSLLLRHYIFKL